ncbi:type IV pilin protein [Marinobacterium stanieri]|uniref:Type IV pilus assembly protein PilE n=1 Tax=Marinobacterium stanieri TaxID=49186 RepID=A0A1N6SD95_9GAMM|nr:type IV pilin protein [Marinobacterium stanieri]SIQ38936.1 type IV pilus assembly protein PilE [Marinobacterium stanieri]
MNILHRSKGFTLVEIMVAVAIVGIMAAIALPAYFQYVTDARRSDGRANLLQLAQFMERYYTANGRYVDAAGNAPALPFIEAPRDGADKFYDLALGVITAQTYTLTATPKNALAGDACGTLTLNQAGVRGAGGNIDECW